MSLVNCCPVACLPLEAVRMCWKGLQRLFHTGQLCYSDEPQDIQKLPLNVCIRSSRASLAEEHNCQQCKRHCPQSWKWQVTKCIPLTRSHRRELQWLTLVPQSAGGWMSEIKGGQGWILLRGFFLAAFSHCPYVTFLLMCALPESLPRLYDLI